MPKMEFVIAYKDTVLAEEGTFFIVGRDGCVYLRKDTGLIKATVKVGRIAALQKIEPSVEIRMAPIPSSVVHQAIQFFREVQQLWNTEVGVLIHYDETNRAYRLVCPQQTVSFGGIHTYSLMDRLEGYLLVGSIHSHGTMGAFHSSIDRADEFDFDGVHITVGHLDQPNVEIVCSIVVNGNRFPIAPETHLLGIHKVEPPLKISGSDKRKYSQSEKFDWWNESSVLPKEKVAEYDLVVLSNDETLQIPDEWFGKIVKRELIAKGDFEEDDENLPFGVYLKGETDE